MNRCRHGDSKQPAGKKKTTHGVSLTKRSVSKFFLAQSCSEVILESEVTQESFPPLCFQKSVFVYARLTLIRVFLVLDRPVSQSGDSSTEGHL